MNAPINESLLTPDKMREDKLSSKNLVKLKMSILPDVCKSYDVTEAANNMNKAA